MKTTSKITFLCFFFFSTSLILYGQYEDLKISLILYENEIRPLEPFYYKYEIKNEGKEEVSVSYNYRGQITAKLQYKHLEDTNWEYLHHLDKSEAEKFAEMMENRGCGIPSRPPPPISLTPDSSFTSRYSCFMPMKEDNSSCLFEENNDYLLRIELTPEPGKDTTVIYSEAITVKIMPYKGKEKRAYKLLKRTITSPHYVYRVAYQEFIYLDSLDIFQEKIAQEVVEKYPNTSFGEWAGLTLASYYLKKAGDSKDLNVKNFLAIKADFYATKLLTSQDQHLRKVLKNICYYLIEIKSYTAYKIKGENFIEIYEEEEQKWKTLFSEKY